jgi:TatD DNase family protein
MNELVDTHCHIQSIGATKGERHTIELWQKAEGLTAEKAIANAASHGVTRLICVGCEINDSKMAIDFVEGRNNCYASVGIHPHEASGFNSQDHAQTQFESLLSAPKVVAIGECGLDYFYDHSPRGDQLKVLEFQLEMATRYDRPVIFHVRQAFEDFWPVLDNYPSIRGVLHSYTDNQINLDEALKRNLYIGVNGIATFAKTDEQKLVYKNIPTNNLLLETDSPYLTPVPYRGKINEPMRIGVIVDFISDLRSENRSVLAGSTTKNALELFRIN